MGTTFPDNLSEQARLERAKVLTGKLVDHTCALIRLAENNAVVLYSDRLSAQIPRSRAANAFNDMQHSMQSYFLVRLSAIWDKGTADRVSIPTVHKLISTPEVKERVVRETYHYHATVEEPRRPEAAVDPEQQRFLSEHRERMRKERGAYESERVGRWFAAVDRVVPKVEQTYLAAALRPFRDGFLAHNLRGEAVNKGNPVKFRRGHEMRLLKLTIYIVDRLHLALNGASFYWEGARRQARRNASELWHSCRFDLPPGR